MGRVSGYFCGMTTVDIIFLVDGPPRADEKIVAADQLLVAGGPATNAAVAFAALGGQSVLASAVGRHPLRGIIHTGDGGSAALMGGRVVRAGDVLLPGVASVERIESRTVTLLYRGTEVPVELPPLRPRSRPRSDREGGGGATTIGAGGAELDSGQQEDRDA